MNMTFYIFFLMCCTEAVVLLLSISEHTHHQRGHLSAQGTQNLAQPLQKDVMSLHNNHLLHWPNTHTQTNTHTFLSSNGSPRLKTLQPLAWCMNTVYRWSYSLRG